MYKLKRNKNVSAHGSGTFLIAMTDIFVLKPWCSFTVQAFLNNSNTFTNELVFQYKLSHFTYPTSLE